MYAWLSLSVLLRRKILRSNVLPLFLGQCTSSPDLRSDQAYPHAASWPKPCWRGRVIPTLNLPSVPSHHQLTRALLTWAGDPYTEPTKRALAPPVDPSLADVGGWSLHCTYQAFPRPTSWSEPCWRGRVIPTLYLPSVPSPRQLTWALLTWAGDPYTEPAHLLGGYWL